MEGETLLWMQIADNQDWSLSEAQQKVASSELILWKAYFEWKIHSFHREDYHAALIASEIARVLSKKPKSIKLEQYLLRFEKKAGKEKMTAETIETRSSRSKMFWLAIAGVSKKQKKKKGDD